MKKKFKKSVVRVGAFIVAMGVIASAMYATHAMTRSFSVNSPVRAAEAGSSARAMYTMDVNSGRVFFEKNANAQMPIASTTKILTAITVLENTDDLDTPFEIDSRAVGVEGTSIYLQKGEKLTVRELLLGMMLRSGNDASNALALRISPSLEEFAKLMNQTAKKAGAENSHFTNAHGLDCNVKLYGTPVSTARDLALITAYAMKNPTFREIAATKETKISGPDYKRPIRNKNRLLHGMEDCVGVKTGFTKKAGRCFVGAAEDNGMTVVNVVLNCGPMFEESATFMERSLQEFPLTRLIEKDQFINTTCGTRAIATEDFIYPTSKNDQVEIKIENNKACVYINGNKVSCSPCNVL